MADLATLVLRIPMGVMFMAHGLQKCFGLFGGSGITGFSGMLEKIGLVPALFWAYLAGYTELISGLFLILGLFPRAASFSLLILMAVATVKVHLPSGFFLSNGGLEYNLIISSVLVSLMMTGSGKHSLLNKF